MVIQSNKFIMVNLRHSCTLIREAFQERGVLGAPLTLVYFCSGTDSDDTPQCLGTVVTACSWKLQRCIHNAQHCHPFVTTSDCLNT